MKAFITVRRVWDVDSEGLVVLQATLIDGNFSYVELGHMLGFIYQDEAEIEAEVRDAVSGVHEVIIEEI